jgi:hypothetical protein
MPNILFPKAERKRSLWRIISWWKENIKMGLCGKVWIEFDIICECFLPWWNILISLWNRRRLPRSVWPRERGLVFSIDTTWADISFPKILFYAVGINKCLNQRCAKCGPQCNIGNTEQKVLNSKNSWFVRILTKTLNINFVTLYWLTSVNSASW